MISILLAIYRLMTIVLVIMIWPWLNHRWQMLWININGCYGPYDGPEYCKVFVDMIISMIIIIITYGEREGVE